MAEPNYTGFIDRILAILQDNAEFSNKISEFRFGELPKEEYGNAFPLCYVTTVTSSFSTNDRYGISVPSSDVQSTIHLQISLVANSVSAERDGDPESVKRQLTQLVDDTIRILRSNPRFYHPPDDDNTEQYDPLCIRSLISSVEELSRLRGRNEQVATITLQCQIGSHVTITIPGITGLIPVLFLPRSRETVGYAPHLNTDGVLQGYAATTESKSRYYEVEHTKQIKDTLDSLKASKDEFEFTQTVRGESETLRGYVSAVNPETTYDGLPTLFLEFMVI